QAGYITEAATTAEAVLRLQPDHRLALEARVVAMARLGKLPEAVAAARAVAEAHPEDAAARRMVAELMVRQEAPAQEIRDYLEQDEHLAQEKFSFALLRTEAATLTNDAEALLERATHAATLPITSVTDLNAFLRLLDLLAPARPEARDLIDTVLGSSF